MAAGLCLSPSPTSQTLRVNRLIPIHIRGAVPASESECTCVKLSSVLNSVRSRTVPFSLPVMMVWLGIQARHDLFHLALQSPF